MRIPHSASCSLAYYESRPRLGQEAGNWGWWTRAVPHPEDMLASLDRTLITGLPLFAGLRPEQLDGLLREAQAVAKLSQGHGGVPPGCRGPAPSSSVLLHGHLRVFKLTPDGQQVVVRFVVPGEVFGVAMAIGCTAYPGSRWRWRRSPCRPLAAWPRLVAAHPESSGQQHAADGRHAAAGHAHPRRRDVDAGGRAPRRARAAAPRPAGRSQGRDRATLDFPISRQDVAEMRNGTMLHTVSLISSAWRHAACSKSARQRYHAAPAPPADAAGRGHRLMRIRHSAAASRAASTGASASHVVQASSTPASGRISRTQCMR